MRRARGGEARAGQDRKIASQASTPRASRAPDEVVQRVADLGVVGEGTGRISALVARLLCTVTLRRSGTPTISDTVAVIDALKSRHVGALALDVYDEEADLLFEDRSADVITDDACARLMTFPNVLVTAQQAILTHEALDAIATTTSRSRSDLEAGRPCPNAL